MVSIHLTCDHLYSSSTSFPVINDSSNSFVFLELNGISIKRRVEMRMLNINRSKSK